MSRQWTVQCSYVAHHANTVTVEADTLEEALEKALWSDPLKVVQIC